MIRVEDEPATLEEALVVIRELRAELGQSNVVELRAHLREGDVVDYRPTGETLVISVIHPGRERFIPNGWPVRVLDLAECTLVEHGDDEDHRRAVRVSREMGEDRALWARAHSCEVCRGR